MRFVSSLIVVLLASTTSQQVYSQPEHSTPSFTFAPGRLLSPPLTASSQEPRVGLRKEIASSKMKVDIGASVELLEFQPSSDSTERFRVGIDFFAYALSTNSEGLRLQIDAVDGYFGGHVSYFHDLDRTARLILRLRLLHLSAHFLDGHFNNATQSWKDNRAPIPFTRDYGELLGFYETNISALEIRLYGGFSYATLIRPTNIERFEFHGGFELHTSAISGMVFGKPFNLYLAHHITLRGIPRYVGTNTLDAGMKFGEWSSTGLKIYLSYHNGLDVFSQYYDVRRENVGIGFAFDFW